MADRWHHARLLQSQPDRRWRAAPDSIALARHLAAELDVRCGRRVEQVDFDGRGWQLDDDAEQFDLLAPNVPPAGVERLEVDVSAGTFVAVADAVTSRRWLESDPEAFVAALLSQVLNCLPEVAVTATHRWRYAACERPLGMPCWFDPGRPLGPAGDWCPGGEGVQAALSSGAALAGQPLRWHHAERARARPRRA